MRFILEIDIKETNNKEHAIASDAGVGESNNFFDYEKKYKKVDSDIYQEQISLHGGGE